MRYLTIEEVLRQCELMGLKVRDVGLLDSALHRPQAAFAGQEAYPGLPLKAAALLHSLAMNHALYDGNKRLAWVATRTFLRLNGQDSQLTGSDIVNLVLGVITGTEAFGGDNALEHVARHLLVVPIAATPQMPETL